MRQLWKYRVFFLRRKLCHMHWKTADIFLLAIICFGCVDLIMFQFKMTFYNTFVFNMWINKFADIRIFNTLKKNYIEIVVQKRIIPLNFTRSSSLELTITRYFLSYSARWHIKVVSVSQFFVFFYTVKSYILGGFYSDIES